MRCIEWSNAVDIRSPAVKWYTGRWEHNGMRCSIYMEVYTEGTASDARGVRHYKRQAWAAARSELL